MASCLELSEQSTGCHIDHVEAATVPRHCVSCHATSKCKLLSCLHTCCVNCLRQNLLDNGKVACPCDGCGELSLLPMSGGLDGLPANHFAEHAESAAGSAHTCEECPEEDGTPAVQSCEECRLLLCEFHVRAHEQSRRTRSHTLIGDVESASRARPVLCGLHPSREVRSYCRDCARLVCERCIELGTHAVHTILKMEEAGAEFRERLRLRAVHARDHSVRTLQSALTKVKDAMRKVNASAEEHSAAIGEKKQAFLRLLQEDEDENIAFVDRERWSKLKTLEIQEQTLRGLVEMGSRAVKLSLDSSQLTDAEFLEVSPVLESNILRVGEESWKSHGPGVSSDITCSHSWHRIEPPEPPAPIASAAPSYSATAVCPTCALQALLPRAQSEYADAFPFHFDPHQCQENITLSDCNLTASSDLSDSTNHMSVLGTEGCGQNERVKWRVLLRDVSNLMGSSIHIGATNRPHALSSRESWVLRSGKFRSQDSAAWEKISGMPHWRDGMVLTFTLDNTNYTSKLSLEIERDGFSFSMDLDNVYGALYPFFYVNYGQSITLLPCEQDFFGRL